MPVVAECPHCGRKGNVPDQYRGRSAKCPDCSGRFVVGASAAAPAETVPSDAVAAAAGSIQIECPECGFAGRAPEQARGRKVKCRKCGEAFVVAAPVSAAAVVASESGPAVKLLDRPVPAAETDEGIPETTELAPLEEKTASTETAVEAAADTVEEAEVIEEAEVVEDTKSAPEVPSEESPWNTLDEVEEKKRPAARPAPAARLKKKPDAKKNKAAMVLAAVGAGVGGLFLVIAIILAGMWLIDSGKIEKTKVASAPTVPSPPVRPPTFAQRMPASQAVRRPPPPPPNPPEKRPVFEQNPPPEVPPPPEPKEGEWVDASRQPGRLGDALVRLAGARVDAVGLKLRDAKVGDTREYLLLQIEVENTSREAMLRYSGWGGTRVKPGEEVPTLADEKGNFYRRILLEDLQGQVTNLELLAPGKKVEDLLVFEVPAEKATTLNLELPGSYLAGKGVLKLRIPMHMVARAAVEGPGPRAGGEETARVKGLRAALKKAKDGPTRVRLCAELGLLRGEAAPAVPDIATYLKDPNDLVRVAAAEALAFIGPDARGAIRPLIEALKDDFWKVRAHAATALGAIGPAAKAAVPLLRQLAGSKDEEVPERAAEALRRIEKK